MFDEFFDEWDDEPEAFKLQIQVSLLFLLLLLGVLTVLRENKTAYENATILLFLLVVTLVFALVEWFSEQKVGDLFGNIVNFVSVGETRSGFYFAILVGSGIGLFLSGTALVILTPLASLGVAFTELNQRFFGFLFSVILAPFVEENFFRGLITPTFIGLGRDNDVFQRIFMAFIVASLPLLFGEVLLGVFLAIGVFLLYTFLPVDEGLIRDLLSIVIASVPFGLFHLYAYGGVFESVLKAVGFGIALSIGNYFFKSYGFGLGVHWANNAVAHLRQFGSFL